MIVVSTDGHAQYCLAPERNDPWAVLPINDVTAMPCPEGQPIAPLHEQFYLSVSKECVAASDSWGPPR